MWSENRKIDVLVNILIFLVAINFFHYGQLILPLICLILFIDNKYKFNVNNIKVFILLCLFGITFCLFSFKLGFYCVMGFCLPMAYYIGSNIKNHSETSIKRVIYIITLGMISHVILNMIYSYVVVGPDILTTQGHYDIWIGSKISDTATAVNYVFIIGILYYVIFYEKNMTLKILGLILFLVVMAYDMFLGRRTPILMSALAFIYALLVDMLFIHKKRVSIKTLLIVICSLVVLVVAFFLVYKYCLSNWGRVLVYYSTLFSKFRREGLSSGRLEVFLDTVRLLPSHIWGGQEITEILEVSPHDLLLDTYDFAGVIPFVLLTAYVVYCIGLVIKTFRSSFISQEQKCLLIPLMFSITLQLCLEPIMSGASCFLIIAIIFITIVEKVLINEGRH